MRAVTVLGGSVAGLSAALVLARDGHRVTVFERDRLEVGDPQAAPDWERRGITHFRQPHAFIPRSRSELRALLPDVYEALLAAGAHDVDVGARMPGGPGPGDGDLQYVGVRRPVIEWALRRAARDEGRIAVRDGVRVEGVTVAEGRVAGVRAGGSVSEADLVVDALGRRTPTVGWLAEAGLASTPTETSDCGVVYYSRYYRLRPGCDLPAGPWLLGPRGDLGYLGYSTFPGDNGTFAGLLAVPNGVADWRAFSEAAAFEAAAARIPALASWLDPALVEPVTDVMPMAGLRNSLRHHDPSAVVGLVPVGDALSHTDPVLAHGLAFSLIQAGELARALREHPDVGDAGAAYTEATMPAVRERYRFATELDEQRRRMWTGQPVDFTRAGGDYALFSMMAAAAASSVDAPVFRAFVRRIGLLDSTAVLDGDPALHRRIEEIFAGLRATPRPAPGPPRDEMLAAAAAGRAT